MKTMSSEILVWLSMFQLVERRMTRLFTNAKGGRGERPWEQGWHDGRFSKNVSFLEYLLSFAGLYD